MVLANYLTPGYTQRRRIGSITSNCLATVTTEELAWIGAQWNAYTGSDEDQDYNVIAEFTTPITDTRVWVFDRDGPDSSPIIMLPSDY